MVVSYGQSPVRRDTNDWRCKGDPIFWRLPEPVLTKTAACEIVKVRCVCPSVDMNCLESAGFGVCLISATLEVLHFPFVLLGRCPGLKRPEVSALACLRVLLARIQPIAAR